MLAPARSSDQTGLEALRERWKVRAEWRCLQRGRAVIPRSQQVLGSLASPGSFASHPLQGSRDQSSLLPDQLLKLCPHCRGWWERMAPPSSFCRLCSHVPWATSSVSVIKTESWMSFPHVAKRGYACEQFIGFLLKIVLKTWATGNHLFILGN